jgi:CRP/FNR family transcriptional regulator, cyclic AMP receptor protein
VDIAQRVNLLAQSELFAGLDAQELREVARRTGTRDVGKGQLVFSQGEPGDEMFLLGRGVVKLLVRSPDGEVVELVRHTAPAVFGELALLDGRARSASAEAVEPSTLLVLHREVLAGLLVSHRRVMEALLRTLGSMVRRTTDQVSGLVFLDLRGRVARQLVTLAGGASRTPPVTQTELANMVGGTRQTVNQILGSLEQGGFIRPVGRTFELLDRAKLEFLAGG